MITEKARIIAAGRKEKTDRLPFGARIDVWYNYHRAHNSLPVKYRGNSIVEICRDQGAGSQLLLLRTWRVEYANMEVKVTENPPRKTTEWHTPLGTVSMTTIFTPEEGPWIAYEVDHPFKKKEDYPVIEYILQNTRLVADTTEYDRLVQMAGDDAVIMTGMDLYSPMQQIMRYWIGFERFFYELHDNKAEVERIYELEKELAKHKIKILSQLPVEMVRLCANWSDEFHTPVFRPYFIPWLRETSDYFHSIGKLTHVHADGEMKRLIPFFPETHVDIAEAWSPVPMTSVTTADLRKAWGEKVTVWGGIPATLFGPQYSDEEFDDYIKEMFRAIAPGYNFIVGMGDNIPFDGKIERIGRVARLIEKNGILPI